MSWLYSNIMKLIDISSLESSRLQNDLILAYKWTNNLISFLALLGVNLALEFVSDQPTTVSNSILPKDYMNIAVPSVIKLFNTNEYDIILYFVSWHYEHEHEQHTHTQHETLVRDFQAERQNTYYVNLHYFFIV